MDNQTTIDKIIQEVESAITLDHLILPSAPDSIVRIRQLLDDPDTSNTQLVQAISSDAALTARILKVSNSASYVSRGKIDNLTDAISRIGLKLIKVLVTNHAMMQIFYPQHGKTSLLIQKVYEHSIEVARLSYAIASTTKYLSVDDALLAGLVHDIGYLPLLQIVTKYNGIALDNKKINSLMINEHPRIGAILLRKWNFPDNIIDVVENHEHITRTDTGNADLTDVVRVADMIMAADRKQFEPHIARAEDINTYIRLAIRPECNMDDFSEYYEKAKTILPDL
ncbi:MAG: HDOD domain-containing protein [Gammaproteobacteria bacterium]|nr:HDOD domain-containing protein [Gammaproteobacteria bacterium]